MNVVVNVDVNRRLVVSSQGGLELEAYVPGPGWVIDTDADVPDSVLECHLEAAIKALRTANSKLGCVSLGV